MNWSKGADEFETDSTGHIVSSPLIDWTVASVDSLAVLCKLEYGTSKEDVDSGVRKVLQILLTTDQAQELASALDRHGKRLEAKTDSLRIM